MFVQCNILRPEHPDKGHFELRQGKVVELDISVTTKAALPWSQESHGMGSFHLDTHLISEAPPCTHVSDSNSSGTSAGDSRRSVSAQPSCASAPSSPYPFAYQCNEESEPERDGRGLQASVARNNDSVDEELPVLSHMNPKRGSSSGGEEIYLIVRNLPPTATLYARFGCNIAPTVSSLTGAEPAERNECTEKSSLVSHCERYTCLPSPSSDSSRSRLHYTVSSAFRSREMLWDVSSFLRIRSQHF